MKKTLLFIVVGLIVVAVSANWYYTRQVRDQLDRMASMASMFGTLSYEGVRLSPGGAININDLSFRLHQGRGGVDIEQISLQTANLLALMTLEGNLERGRFPETLGLRVKNIQFPLDGALATMAQQTPGSASPTGTSSVLFNAAGCDGRTQFTANDLMQMDYFDIRADLEAHYRLIDNGNRLRLFVSARNHDASAMDLEVTFDISPGSLSTSDLARSMENARLHSFSLEYEDLGFYDRMLTFCADEMSMTEPAYIAHHLESWKQAWSPSGVEPGPDTVAAYQSFLEDPQQLRVSSNAEHGVSFEGIERYTMPGFLERMEARLVVNYGEPRPLDMNVLDGSSRRIVSTDQPASTEGAATPPEAADPQAASMADIADTTADADADANADAPEEAVVRPDPSQWIEVDPARVEAHLDQRLRIRMQSGDRYAGRLVRVESGQIHIRVERPGGFYIRPLARGEIQGIEAFED